MTDADTRPRQRTEPAYSLVAKPDEITHLVCCRDVSWGRAFCGAEETEINLAATVPCTMCIEQAEVMLPGCLTNDPILCPVDGNPCPDEHEIDLRIAREAR
jgi:hypothetical protein